RMGFVEKQRADEQEQDHANYGIDDGGLAQTTIVRFHQREHSHEADEEPRGLAREKDVRVAVLLFRGDSGGAENHPRAKQAQRQRRAKEPAVIFQSSWHDRSPSRRSRTRSLALQLMHQLFEYAAAVFEILKLIEAGACGSQQHHVARTRRM